MKICTFCGIENDDAAMQCRECCTEELRVPTLAEVTPSVTPTEAQSEWELWSELPVTDAKTFLQCLEEANIEYRLNNNEPSAQCDVVTASHGGKFGRGGLFRILTWSADKKDVQKVWRRFCNFKD